MRSALLALVLLAACKDSGSGAGAGSSASAPDRFAASKAKQAKLMTEKLAFEAYPSWSAAHPEKACPAKLEDLLEYADLKTPADPWGGTYRMYCGENAPAGVRGLGISSPGPDGKDGTADDIKSWQ